MTNIRQFPNIVFWALDNSYSITNIRKRGPTVHTNINESRGLFRLFFFINSNRKKYSRQDEKQNQH